jgi:AcrR family transcriptional regulator
MPTRSAPTRGERKARTRAELIAAADRLFARNGFHATSIDVIADQAGYTKGAVYSNFSTKEDLFFAVYEARVRRGVEDLEARFARASDFPAAFERIAGDVAARRGQDDGWLAVFFEFWAHVLRHPELRSRFAELHAAAIRPAVDGLVEFAAERGMDLPDDARKLVTAWNAMQVGLSLERLTQPEVVDSNLGARMARLAMQDLETGDEDGLQT